MTDTADVLVVGGSTGAVAAAVSAATPGGKVILVTDRTYLGEDMCAHHRMWLHAGESAEAGLAGRIFAEGCPAKPLHVKHTLDRELESAGVSVVFSSFVTDVLSDGFGEPAGVVTANRTGRQAIFAKTIIDATDRAWIARRAGAEFAEYPRGAARFTRVVVGGTPRAGAGIESVRVLDSKIEGYDVIQYQLTIEMADGSWQSFANAEQLARDLTFDVGQVDESESLWQVPPDALKAQSPHVGALAGVTALDIGVARPAGLQRLFVLGGCAGISREAAETLMRPANLIAWGEVLGEAAYEEAQSTSTLKDVTVPEDTSEGLVRSDRPETLTGFRPTDEPDLPALSLPAGLPVLGEYDVVVVGGGTGGAPAGIGAARGGAKTLVVEYQRGLGGVTTLGLIGKYYYGNRVGFTSELDAALPPQDDPNYIPRKMEWLRAENRKAGSDVWFGAINCGAFVQGKRVKGVVIATPEGRGVVLAKTVIDSTGNADVAAAAGAECTYTAGEHIGVQGTGLPQRNLGISYTNTDYTFADDTDVTDVSGLFVWAREKFAGAYDLGQLVDTRERRRIVGEFLMSPMDIINERTYPDTIVTSYSNFDSHGFTVHPFFFVSPPDKVGMHVDVPLRCLLPKGIDGLLVTGLGVSAHRDAMPVIRMQPDIQNQGYAAGRLAAMAAHAGTDLRNVDVKDLQRHLVDVGILDNRTLTDVDSHPAPEATVRAAVGLLGKGRRTDADEASPSTEPLDFKHALAIAVAHIETALPMMRGACSSQERSPEERLVYAHALGIFGDATGADLLAQKVSDANEWDQGWNYVGMGQFGPSISELDSYVIALARTRAPSALEPILKLASLLNASRDFSHHRAISIACETLRRAEATPVLAEILARPGMTGYHVTNLREARARYGNDPCENEPRNRALRELVIARALYRCGDSDGLGRKILETYSEDLRGPFSRHARAILAE